MTTYKKLEQILLEVDPKPISFADVYGRAMHDLRISVTDRCNFRCTYCMPKEQYGEHYRFLPKKEILTFEEITRVAGICVALGVRKLRLTGGEPLLRVDLPKLIEMLRKECGDVDIALTTNGFLLGQIAQKLFDAGLTRLTVSLDSLEPAIFNKMTGGLGDVKRVLDGIEAARRVGFCNVKINTVVQRGVNDQGIVDIARYFKGTGHTVRFIEYMDVGTKNHWLSSEVVSGREMLERLKSEFALVPLHQTYLGEVAKRYAYADGSGEIGFITSVTAPFCGDCTRLRLSADGRLYTCLFASNACSIKQIIRQNEDDDALRSAILRAWSSRRDRYSEQRTERRESAREQRVEMYQIGG